MSATADTPEFAPGGYCFIKAVVGLDYEMDCRGLAVEDVVNAATASAR